MADEKPVVGEDKKAGVDLHLVEEQRARVHLGIPVYANEADKHAGRMKPLTEEQQWKVDEYLGRAHAKPTEAGFEASESEGVHLKTITYEELSEKIFDHSQRMRDAFEDMRGRIGIGEDGLVPEPGSEAEHAVLDEVMEHVNSEIVRLYREGRTSEDDPEYADVLKTHASLKEYVKHRKAYLGLSTYRKEHFPSREADQEKQEQERAKEKENAIAAEEVYKSILQRFVGKMR